MLNKNMLNFKNFFLVSAVISTVLTFTLIIENRFIHRTSKTAISSYYNGCFDIYKNYMQLEQAKLECQSAAKDRALLLLESGN